MQRHNHGYILSLILALPIACASNADKANPSPGDGTSNDFINDGDPGSAAGPSGNTPTTLKAAPFVFPGAGTSQAALPLAAGLGPETSAECNPEPVAGASATIADVQTVCFYGADSADVPAAAIEQVVEVIGNDEWVHVRLILNPDFVDNTYGANAIGWGEREEGADPAAPPAPGPDAPARVDAGAPPPANAPPPPPAPGEPPAPVATDAGAPAPAAPGDTPPPAAGPGQAGPGQAGPGQAGPRQGGPGGGRGPGRGGHTFDDLVGSDHAELQLLDASGGVALQFKLDYLSASEAAKSGFASLGVSGGEGKLIVGDEAMILASTTSMDRNLVACGLSSFLEDSPATDASYTPNAAAPEWDYRVSYEVWVAADAFGSAGFGSALIELVHASPSKLESDSVDVKPAPCPVDPSTPELAPEPLPSVLSNLR
jgi:hypothetical protein